MHGPFQPEIFSPVANLLAQVGEDIILPIYRRPDMAVEMKDDHTPVTEADGKAEAALREGLAKLFPGADFIGEETDGKDWRKSPLLHEENGLWVPDRSRKVFIMDPIDGTINFAMGPKVGRRFATMLALFDRGDFAASWIYYPLTRECLFVAAQGPVFLVVASLERTWSEPQLIRTKAVQNRPLNMEFMLFELLKDKQRHIEEGRRIFGPVVGPEGRMAIMTCIAECLYNMIVKNELDMTVSPSYTSPWDLWTTAPLFERAGAVVVSETGNHYRAVATRGGIVARDPQLAEKLRQAIAAA